MTSALGDHFFRHEYGRLVAILSRRVGVHHLEAGLDLLEGLAPPSWLAGSYLWAAALADLHRRAGNTALAKQHRVIALASAPSTAVRAALERRPQSVNGLAEARLRRGSSQPDTRSW